MNRIVAPASIMSLEIPDLESQISNLKFQIADRCHFRSTIAFQDPK